MNLINKKIPETTQPNQYYGSIFPVLSKLMDPNLPINDEDIVSFVKLYLVGYIYFANGEKESNITLEKIVAYIQTYSRLLVTFQLNDYLSILNEENADADINNALNFYHLIKKGYDYSCMMLGDIYSTAEIVKSIITKKLLIEDGDFIGFDVGSGSGILLLCQYILAKRSGFKNINLTGIEIGKNTSHVSQKFLHAILDGVLDYKSCISIVNGDATSSEIYDNFKEPINFISNETIPNSDQKCNDADPFLLTNLAIINSGVNVSKACFFPEKITFQDKNSEIALDIKELMETKNTSLLSELKSLSPKKILLNGLRLNLNEVGDGIAKMFGEDRDNLIGRRTTRDDICKVIG